MTLHPRLTRATVALVKRFETFQPAAERVPSGGWSIGYGHTRSAREGARVSAADAEMLLIYDLDAAARVVEGALFAPVTQAQYEALTALCFNLGEAAFLRSSALARVNAGAELDAADEIERWRQAELGAGTQVVDALFRRRAAEKAHFLGLPEGVATWPSGQRRPIALPGGETAEPAAALECPTSAALDAANGVQARLRRLIPDEALPPEPSPPAVELPLGIEPPAADVPASETHDATTVDQAPSAEPIAWEPTPPPFDPPGPLAVLKDFAPPAPGPTVGPQPRAAPAQPPSPAGETPPERPARPRDTRLPSVLLGLLGVALFLAGVAMILGGRPGLLNLGLGVVGVILAVSGLYGLLGGPRSAAEPEPTTPKPFPPGAVDTK